MEPRKILQLAYDAGYLLDNEYAELVSLGEQDLKRKIRSRVWSESTDRRGVYTFKKLSPREIKGIENQWVQKLPKDVKGSGLRLRIKRRFETARDAFKAGRVSQEALDEARALYRDTFQAKSLEQLEVASEILEDSRFGGVRRPYTIEYAREYNIDVNDKLYHSNTPEGKQYKVDIGEQIKKAQNNEYAAAKRGESQGSLSRQKELLSQSKESYGKTFAKQGYRSWLKHNPNAIVKDAHTWWDLQPDHAKRNWYDLGEGIQKQNNEVIRKYTDAGQIAPKSALLQWHHLMPKSFGGVHAPENIIAAMGDAFTKEGGRHARLHDVRFKPVYSEAQKSGAKALSFAPDIIDKMPLSQIKRMGMSLMNMKGVKGAGKVGKRLLGPASAVFAGNAAWNYLNEGHPLRAAYASASVIPGPIGWASYGLEEASNIIDRDKERMANRDNIFETPFQKRRKKRITGLLNN